MSCWSTNHLIELRLKQVKGSAGLLVEAKSRGMIDAVRPYLEGMIDGGYFLGPTLVEACLTAAGEV